MDTTIKFEILQKRQFVKKVCSWRTETDVSLPFLALLCHPIIIYSRRIPFLRKYIFPMVRRKPFIPCRFCDTFFLLSKRHCITCSKYIRDQETPYSTEIPGFSWNFSTTLQIFPYVWHDSLLTGIIPLNVLEYHINHIPNTNWNSFQPLFQPCIFFSPK